MNIEGKVTIDGRETQFLIPIDGGSTSYSQWGADTITLGGRCELLQAIHDAAAEWALDELCTTCWDHTLDDGEGYDGKCGNCADIAERDKS